MRHPIDQMGADEKDRRYELFDVVQDTPVERTLTPRISSTTPPITPPISCETSAEPSSRGASLPCACASAALIRRGASQAHCVRHHSYLWHQFFRHHLAHAPAVHFLWRPGALLGTFGVSIMFHFSGLWGTEFGRAVATTRPVACDFLIPGLRPRKSIVDGIIALITNYWLTYLIIILEEG